MLISNSMLPMGCSYGLLARFSEISSFAGLNLNERMDIQTTAMDHCSSLVYSVY